MTLKIKIEGIKEYSLGGVKKIMLDEEYLYTTIFDTRKYRRCDIEKLEIVDEKAVDKE